MGTTHNSMDMSMFLGNGKYASIDIYEVCPNVPISMISLIFLYPMSNEHKLDKIDSHLCSMKFLAYNIVFMTDI